MRGGVAITLVLCACDPLVVPGVDAGPARCAVPCPSDCAADCTPDGFCRTAIVHVAPADVRPLAIREKALFEGPTHLPPDATVRFVGDIGLDVPGADPDDGYFGFAFEVAGQSNTVSSGKSLPQRWTGVGTSYTNAHGDFGVGARFTDCSLRGEKSKCMVTADSRVVVTLVDDSSHLEAPPCDAP